MNTEQLRNMFDFLKSNPEGKVRSLSFANSWLNFLFSQMNMQEEERNAIDELCE